MLDFHPSARDNFNAKAEELLKLLREIPRQLSAYASSFPSEVHKVELPKNSIVGEIKEKLVDNQGRTIGIFFRMNGIMIGLEKAEYANLSTLAESIQRLPQIREKLSQEFIEEALFSWLKEKYITKEINDTFINHLESLAGEQVKAIIVYVPIAQAIVEVHFKFCGAIIKNISKELIDDITSRVHFTSDQDKDAYLRWAERFRKKYQGYAAATFLLECEPKQAIIVSLEKARIISDLLGIYSGAVLFPYAKSFSKIKGTENIEGYEIILQTDEDAFETVDGTLDTSYMYRPLMISKVLLEHCDNDGLFILSNIATKKNPSEFEKTVLTMAMLYSKAAFTADPMAKLVYILSALESTFLKSESEPIQQNLSERMAFFIANELEKRKEIIKNVKSVYALRSKYLHHGHSSEEIEQLSKFFMNVFSLFVKLLKVSGMFKDKNEFLNKIDDIKLS